MGVSYRSEVAVGVRLDRLASLVEEPREVTKYDPDTGKPFQLTLTKEVVHFLGDRRPDWVSDPREWPEDALGGLELFCGQHLCEKHGCYPHYTYVYDYEEAVVGRSLLERDPKGYLENDLLLDEVERPDLDETIREVREALAKLGVDAEPSVFLIRTAG